MGLGELRRDRNIILCISLNRVSKVKKEGKILVIVFTQVN